MIHAAFLLTYLVLFLTAFFFLRSYGYVFPRPIGGFDFLLLCLATFRLTALITEDRVFKFLRAPFVAEKQVLTPEGTKTVEKPAGRGVRRAIGELATCPWCAGIWISTLLVFCRVLFYDAIYLLLLAFSAAGGGILLQLLGKLIDRSAR